MERQAFIVFYFCQGINPNLISSLPGPSKPFLPHPLKSLLSLLQICPESMIMFNTWWPNKLKYFYVNKNLQGYLFEKTLVYMNVAGKA
jgi:hypothetical protein